MLSYSFQSVPLCAWLIIVLECSLRRGQNSGSALLSVVPPMTTWSTIFVDHLAAGASPECLPPVKAK